MTGKYLTLIVLSVVFAVGNTAPRRTRGTSGTNWKQPCGSNVEYMSDDAVTTPDPTYILERMKLIFQNLIRDYRTFCIKTDYKMNVGLDQYLQNGVPNDTKIVELQNLTNREEIVEKLPMLYTDLQKFAVAFEELKNDVSSINGNVNSLVQTELATLRTMCGLTELFKVPDPIGNFTLKPDPQIPNQITYIETRVWGVVLKYDAYLEAWKLPLGIEKDYLSIISCPLRPASK